MCWKNRRTNTGYKGYKMNIKEINEKLNKLLEIWKEGIRVTRQNLTEKNWNINPGYMEGSRTQGLNKSLTGKINPWKQNIHKDNKTKLKVQLEENKPFVLTWHCLSDQFIKRHEVKEKFRDNCKILKNNNSMELIRWHWIKKINSSFPCGDCLHK